MLATWLVLPLLIVGGHASPLSSSRNRHNEINHGICGHGPWGDLKCSPIVISPPAEFLQDFDFTRNNPWHFSDFTESEFLNFLNHSHLSPSDQREIMKSSHPDPAHHGFVVTPNQALVRRLSSRSREYLYTRLAMDLRNFDQVNAFRFKGESVADWFKDAGISRKIIRQLDTLTYRHGAFLFFSDLSLIVPHLSTPEEKQNLLRVLLRKSTLLIKAKVSPRSDLDAMASYWARGGRRKDVRGLLESLASIPGGQSIDIAHLLPGFARQMIYRFSSPHYDSLDRHRDCFWSALNFFNDVPDDRFAVISNTVEEIKENYRTVKGELLLGDLIVYQNSMGRAFHAAIYISGGIVFTKNGPASISPWLYMPMEDMQDFYPQAEPFRITYYRQKKLDYSEFPLSVVNKLGPSEVR